MNKKLGYYVCNGREFDSKIQAYIYATAVKQPVTWTFNNDTFDKFNWTQEPTESLDALYDQRARDLREKSDYVILSYSGGSDSHNILMSFYRQGLRIDEIVTNWVIEGAKKVTILDPTIDAAWNQNAEYELNTREKLQWIADNMPETRVTFSDCSNDIIKHFMQARDESWVLNLRDPVNPAVIQRYNYLNLKNIRRHFDHFQSVVVIVGLDKPRIRIQDKKLYFFTFDTTANIIPLSQHFAE